MTKVTNRNRRQDMQNEQTKIMFRLDNQEDGYPPIQYELINAVKCADNFFQLENAPFFVRNISYHDIVKGRISEVAGQFEFVSVEQASSYTSISIIILEDEMDTFLMDLLRGLNCVIEYGEFGDFRMLAVAIPETTNYQQLRTQLVELENREMISFAELAIAHPLK